MQREREQGGRRVVVVTVPIDAYVGDGHPGCLFYSLGHIFCDLWQMLTSWQLALSLYPTLTSPCPLSPSLVLLCWKDSCCQHHHRER